MAAVRLTDLDAVLAAADWTASPDHEGIAMDGGEAGGPGGKDGAGAVLLFQGLNLKVPVGKNKEPLHILHDVRGCFGLTDGAGGHLVAILGESGSGKTSLLNVLSGNISCEGEVLFNGRPVNPTDVGFVHQEDRHFPQLTVKETLMFAANLKELSVDVNERVAEVLAQLKLSSLADQIVGQATSVPGEVRRGLSGGERKRLSIGVELLFAPAMLFLDEFSSGLDSETARYTTSLLRELADSGRTVVCTIHQPSTEIFNTFDDVCVLQKGRTVYFGPVPGVVAYCSSLGPNYACPQFYSPAEWVLRVVQGNIDRDAGAVPPDFAALFADSEPGRVLEQRVEGAMRDSSKATAAGRKVSFGKMAGLQGEASLGLQFRWLLWRAAVLMRRNKLVVRLKVIMTAFLALLFGLIYYDLPDTQSGITDRIFLLLYSSIIIGVRNMLESVRFFSEEKALFFRQHRRGLYGAFPYLTTKAVVDLVLSVVFPLIYSAVLIPMSGLQSDAGSFFTFMATLFLITSNAQAAGHMLGCLIINERILTVTAPLIILPVLLFSGISAVSIPLALRWIENLNFLRFGLEILVRNEFSGRRFSCEGLSGDTTAANCTSTGEDVIEIYDMNRLSIRDNFLVLLGYLCLFRVLAVVTLQRVASRL